MKTKRFKEEIRQLDVDKLQAKCEQLQKELFSLRLSKATSHVKDNSGFSRLRRDIARVKTEITLKTQASKA